MTQNCENPGMSHRHGTLVEWAIDWMSGIDPYAGLRKTQTFEPVPTGYDGSTAQGRRLFGGAGRRDQTFD
jgi:hypothetical protein